MSIVRKGNFLNYVEKNAYSVNIHKIFPPPILQKQMSLSDNVVVHFGNKMSKSAKTYTNNFKHSYVDIFCAIDSAV